MSDPKKAKLGSDDDAMEVETSLTLKSTREMSSVLKHLRPIVLRLEDHDAAEMQCCLHGMDFLEVNSVSQSKDEILEKVGRIYVEARKLEAASLPRNRDDIDPSSCEAAIEIRNAILHSELEEIGVGGELKVYKGFVPNVQSEGQFTRVVVRPQDEAFWDRCIELSLENHPVCGVGNPGIGKTTTTLYLLQQLVRENQKPVVYTIRKKSGREDIYYEFVPVVQDNVVVDITVKVYKAYATTCKIIPTLKREDAFYVVDPGEYELSCDDSKEVNARFIMAASNNGKHWGGNNFDKFRGSCTPLLLPGVASPPKEGIFVYGCLWTGRQVILSKPYLRPLRDLPDEEVLRRFRIVGGSLRDVLNFDEEKFTQQVDQALEIDSESTVHGLACGTYKFSFKPDEPSSRLIGISPKDNNMTLFKITLKSDYIEERLAFRHLKMSWYAVLDEGNAGNRGNLFESYLRVKFSKGPVRFSRDEARQSLREAPPAGKKNERKNYQPVAVTVGSNRTVVRVSNMIEAVRNDTTQQYMYYSKHESEPLIDMIYRVNDGFHAIQSTIAKKHDADAQKIENLKTALQLGDGANLHFFYALPSTRFGDFRTDPVNPLLTAPDGLDLSNVHIYHISVSGTDQ